MRKVAVGTLALITTMLVGVDPHEVVKSDQEQAIVSLCHVPCHYLGTALMTTEHGYARLVVHTPFTHYHREATRRFSENSLMAASLLQEFQGELTKGISSLSDSFATALATFNRRWLLSDHATSSVANFIIAARYVLPGCEKSQTLFARVTRRAYCSTLFPSFDEHASMITRAAYVDGNSLALHPANSTLGTITLQQ